MQKPRVYYLIGASGSGKDTLINEIKKEECKNLLIAHRYITRKPCETERHVYLSEKEFLLRKEAGLFLISWQAHGLNYGIGKEVFIWLDSGFDVLINGSREAYIRAKKIFSENTLTPILLTVDDDILLSRLKNRKRENEEQIKKRIVRTEVIESNLDKDVIKITNNSSIDSALKQFLNITKNI